MIFDASAALAVIRHEEGSENVLPHLSSGIILDINMCEVVTKLVEYGMEPDDAFAQIARLQLEQVNLDEAAIIDAARLRPLTKQFGFSLGDRACLAFARTRKCAVLTSDNQWSCIDLGVEVIQIR